MLYRGYPQCEPVKKEKKKKEAQRSSGGLLTS